MREKNEGRSRTVRARFGRDPISHQNVDFRVDLEAQVTLDTLLAKHVDVDPLVLAAESAYFRLPLLHVHPYLDRGINARLDTRSTTWKLGKTGRCYGIRACTPPRSSFAPTTPPRR